MKILNKKVEKDYEYIKKYEAGIELQGIEVKNIRAKKANISKSFAKFIDNELFLVNADIGGDTRSRKLLLHKKELISLASKLKEKRLTIIPIALYTRNRLIKIELVLARSRKSFEKRDILRQKDITRDTERELKLSD